MKESILKGELTNIGILTKYSLFSRRYFDKNSACKLSIEDLRIWVHLGCTNAERYNPQLVSFTIDLVFKYFPKGIITDKLEDTVCYLQIVQSIQTLCKRKEFSLIECLTGEVDKVIRGILGLKMQELSSIKIITQKMAPPVPGIHGGVSFSYCDGVK